MGNAAKDLLQDKKGIKIAEDLLLSIDIFAK